MLLQLSLTELGFLYLWGFLICCVCIWTAIYAAEIKKNGYLLISLLLCLATFFSMETFRHVQPETYYLLLQPLTELTALPALLWVLLLTALSVCVLVMHVRIRRWRVHHISSVSIKQCGDGHPAAILFWRENGRVLFANRNIDRLAEDLTGHPVMNGQEFFDALGPNSVPLSDGSVWNYHHRVTVMDGDPLHELTAADITVLYRDTKTLEAENRRLQKMNAELRVYNENVEELVRQQEILNAKIRIHDEMNRLLVSTARVFDEDDAAGQSSMLEAWQNNTALLAGEQTNQTQSNVLQDMHTYGELLGIDFHCLAFPTSSDRDQLRFLVRVTREAMANAAKHGGAENLYANFVIAGYELICTFTDDGKNKPEGPVRLSGGLLNLQREAQRLHGRLEISAEPQFRLTIRIPKGGAAL